MTVELYMGDCLDVMPMLSVPVQAVVTDPPYLNDDTQIESCHPGVTERSESTVSVGMPWGYSLDWIDAAARFDPLHWIVFCNYRMLGGVCSKLEQIAKLSGVFVWRKSNAPRMARPVPRLDCEFIVWARSDKATCGNMREFKSMVIDVPMLQAGCFATERILQPGSGKAAHPTQKPLAVVEPFVRRLGVKSVIDPFLGTGTTGEACILNGVDFVGIEDKPDYFAIAQKRIHDAQLQMPMWKC